jgi:glycosyltransferase involved in cell wall biosynthesis
MSCRVAIVTRALAPYHKALQEPFADAVGATGGHVRILYPQGTNSAFGYENTVPRSASLSVEHVPSIRVSPAIMSLGLRWKSEANETRLPSIRLWQALDRFDPALVWIHEYSPYSLAGLIWAKTHGRPVIVSTDIGMDNQHIFVRRACRWHRFWGCFVDGVIACTRGALKPLASQPMPVVAAFHAADSRKLKPHPQLARHEIQFVQTARVLPIKGADLLLAALARLRDDGVMNWKLRFVGPDHAGWGADQIARFRLQDQVEITGHLDGAALWDAFGNADVFVLATRSDTQMTAPSLPNGCRTSSIQHGASA